MSGKPYTMKEMKAIVDYLTERRVYGEIKGRKMWMNFEKSKVTDRTWQSLKETFLKRILPDIHNPYYQLSLIQITSFRQGYDVEEKFNNKLEVKPVGEGSSTNAVQPENTEQPSTSINKDAEKESGEETINSKTVSHHRDSAETLVLDPCYETAEDIQKELESPKQNAEIQEEDCEKSPTKTLRDFITYSEPLTPMLQEEIDELVSDEGRDPSDDEPQMEIAEDVEDTKNIQVQIFDDTVVEISSETDVSNCNTDMGNDCNTSQDEKDEANQNNKPSQVKNISSDNPKISLAPNINAIDDSEKEVVELHSEKNIEDINNKNQDLNENPPPENETENISKTGTENDSKTVNSSNGEKLTFSQNTCIENFSNSTIDTLIPNNQEALTSNSQPADKDTKEIPSKEIDKNSKNLSRKRANSQELTASKQKKLSMPSSSKSVSVSDTDANDKRNNKSKTNSKIVDHPTESKLQTPEKGSKTENPKKNIVAVVAEVAEVPEVPEEVAKENVEEVINGKTADQNKVDESNVANTKNGCDAAVQKNPCLKSVSLYDEQFTTLQYTESSDDVKNMRTQKKKSVPRKPVLSENEIMMLESNSDDETRKTPKLKATTARNVRSEQKSTTARNVRSECDQALSNVFGFSSGAVTSSRKRRISYQNKPRRQSHNKASSGSSEWTSDSEVEYVSPPRTRRNRHARKYVKPKSARILSLEEEGGLFIMYGKKIYPVVKDGKIMKNINYERDSEDEEESFWKLKYIEERKRTAQLKKLLHKSSNGDQHPIEEGTSSVNQKSSPKRQKTMKTDSAVEDKNSDQEIVPKETVEHIKKVSDEIKVLKIKITKKNEEVHLEGHWSQIHPVLDQVVNIFHHGPEPKSPLKISHHGSESKSPPKISDHGSEPKSPPKISHHGSEPKSPPKISHHGSEPKSPPKISHHGSEPKSPPKISHHGSDPKSPPKKSHHESEPKSPPKISDHGSEPKSYPKITISKSTSENDKRSGSVQIRSSSEMSSPVISLLDSDSEKINEIESEIFKEIEARNKEPVPSTNTTPEKVKEVFLRRGRSKFGQSKSGSTTEPVPDIPEKKLKRKESEKSPIPESRVKPAPAEIGTSPMTKKTRTPKTVLRENTDRNEDEVPNRRPKRTKELPPASPITEDANIRYKLPSPPASGKKTSRKSIANKSVNEQKSKNRNIKRRNTIFSPPDNSSINSIESSQGYQDSDISPSLSLKKKKKNTATYYAKGKFKSRLNTRRKTFCQLDLSDQSSNSCPDLSSKSRPDQESCSEIYKSESYQLLMNKNKNYFNNLERIDEVNLNDHNTDVLVSPNSFTDTNRSKKFHSNMTDTYCDNLNNNSQYGTDVDHSSNVSFPPSPVLSIVENISLRNNELNSIPDDVMSEENACGDHSIRGNNIDYKITDVDVTMPLMQQDCGLQSEMRQNVTEQQFDLNNLPTVMTESFLNKICTVNIHDNPTLSETINQKLRNLLLESAKKIAINSNVTKSASNDKMEIDSSLHTKKDGHGKPKKRSSTPLKRRNTRKKSKRPEIDQSIEEEHTESYSRGGRRSCPPLIPISNTAYNIIENVTNDTVNKKKGRKKKENIIKVKILRPRTRSHLKESNIKNTSPKGESLHGDSGIIDTLSSVLLEGHDASVDLIHNHTETCLQANDCIGDSVEFMECGTKSVISLDTNSDQSIDMERDCRKNSDFGQNAQIELFRNFNHSAKSLGKVIRTFRTNNMVDNEGTTYYTAMNSVRSSSSILTEDLSETDQECSDRTSGPTKWYLLSEDETNTNFSFPTSHVNASYGADLNKLFPITCAIPDLSTITEMSNDKALSARASRNDSPSQSLFDSNR